MKKFDLITIGESLIELSSEKSIKFADSFDKYYGGDTLATAIAALKLGSQTGYITRVGNDHFCEFLLESWQNIGLDISHVKLVDGYNGLYFVTNQTSSTKEFSYYRKKTAACSLSIDDIQEDYIKSAKIVYSTGMTQALSLNTREAVKETFKIAKDNDIIVAYDPNFSEKVWPVSVAKEAFEEILEYVDILFMNKQNDMMPLFDINSTDSIIKYLFDLGIKTVVLKSVQEGGYWVYHNNEARFTEFYTTQVSDTTSAGDVFNGAFLHGIANYYDEFQSGLLGSIAAGLQSQNVGAIKSIANKEEVYRIFKGNEQ